MGPVKYGRRSFDNINDYPPPTNGELVTEWIDRLHEQNISVNRSDILDWFWPNLAFNMSIAEQDELMRAHPTIKFFRWGGRVYLSNTDDLMMLRLSAPDGVHTPQGPFRLKEGS